MRLILRNDKGEETVHEVRGSPISIGRSAGNHLPIDDINSSRHHCEIHRAGDGHELHDRDSRNGTFVNGRKVGRAPLVPGDAIEIGTTVIYFECRPGESALGLPVGRETVDITTGLFPAITEAGIRDSADLECRGCAQREATNAELLRLLALNEALNAESEVSGLLETLIDTALVLSRAERGFLILSEGRRTRVAVARNIDREVVKDAKDKISRGITKEVLSSGLPTLIGDPARCSSGRAKKLVALRVKSVLCAPLKHRDLVFGALYLDHRFESECFDETIAELVGVAANQAAIAVRNLRLCDENLRQRDELKGAKEDLSRLNALLRDRLEMRDKDLAEARAELAKTRDEYDLRFDYSRIVTRSPVMFEVLATLDKIAGTSVSVLIQGESGTGKELVARALHNNGPRQGAPFVSQNCSAIPQHLIESEFFGHERGAFTGAVAAKPGLFELADGGTLFLDEVGDMDLEMQTKLLRVVQDGMVRRIGAKDFRKVDVRILSATHRDLSALMKAERFREDLYYRLNVINVVLPPLRERRDDIPLLVDVFMQAFGEQGAAPDKLGAGVLEALVSYDWPGNVRELENEIERACTLADDEVSLESLSPAVLAAVRRRSARLDGVRYPSREGFDLREAIASKTAEVERSLISAALVETGYRKRRSAELLGISRPTLDARIEKYGLTRVAVLGSEA